MRYQEAFLRTLRPELRAILSRGPQRMGLEPFCVRPGAAGALAATNMPLVDGGLPPASQVTTLPDPEGSGVEQLLHLLITSGTTDTTPAGLFGLPTAAMRFACAAGFVARLIWAPTSTAAGRGGCFLAENFAVDNSFRPERARRGLGYVKIQGAPAEFVAYEGTPDTTFAPAVAMPCDGRVWDMGLACAAQNPSGEVLALRWAIDLSDRDAPVLCDDVEFPVSDADVVRGGELNMSAGTGSGLTAVSQAFVVFEGAQIVRSLL